MSKNNPNEKLYYTACTRFESACELSFLPSKHPSHQLHGHSFLARVRAELPNQWAPFKGAETDHLKQTLTQCVAPLDYDLLNNHLETPTDENLSRWVRQHLKVPNVNSVGIQSTHDEGADLDPNGDAHIWRRYRFEAAHQLPNVEAGHQCGRMHGHGFEVILHVNQNIKNQDMGVDYETLDAAWLPIQNELHLACLNDIEGLENPTSEALSAWIWARLKPKLAPLSWVTIYETATAGCHFDGNTYRIWKEFRFESALTLKQAPKADGRRKLHGHSYILRLHLSAALDPVMQWTVDYGDVKSLFKPIYKQLDHHLLDEIEGLDNADLASIARWIKQQAAPLLPELDRIDVYQTQGCGVILSWGEEGPVLPN